MSPWWAVPMLVSGGLDVGGVASIARERVPTWRATDPLAFRTGLAHTLRRVDRLPPALLVVCVAATIGVAGGAAHPGHAGPLAASWSSLVGSVAMLVPPSRWPALSWAVVATVV